MIETAIPFENHRSMPLAAVAPFVQGMEQAGVVDYFWIWDELSGWFPRHLWRGENTPFAQLRDSDSTHDPFIESAFALAASAKLGVRLTTDAIRSRPAELMRTMLSLASATEGRAVCCLGAGEFRQTKPFGYKRSEGLARMEDVLRIVNLLWEAEEPFDFDGHFWKIRNGYIGTTRPPRRPEFWALGGGPKLIEIAAKYADGFETAAPSSCSTPEAFGAVVRDIRERVEREGRDPDAFGFGIWLVSGIHEDRSVIDRALGNPCMKWLAGIGGRLNQADWEREGLAPVMPRDWHYAMRFAPFDIPSEEADRVVADVPREMVEKSFFLGSPKELAAVAQQFVEAGATFVGIINMLPVALGPEEGLAALQSSLDVCRAVKAGDPDAAGGTPADLASEPVP